jgi:type I site-specific restriction-modification system R (restriction) subunit
MEQSIIQNKPEGFSEYFTKKLAGCVARGIVEKSIRAIHNRKSESHEKGECEDENAGVVHHTRTSSGKFTTM